MICKYGDPSCPCVDGDMCHYEGPNPLPDPRKAVQPHDLMKPTGVNQELKKG